MFKIWGLVVYHWNGHETTFSMVYYMLENFWKLQLQNEKEKYIVI